MNPKYPNKPNRRAVEDSTDYGIDTVAVNALHQTITYARSFACRECAPDKAASCALCVRALLRERAQN